MGARHNLHPGQFVYEVGDDEDDAPERGYRSSRYGSEHEVHPTTLGMPVSEPVHQRFTNRERVGQDRDIPLSKVSVEQPYVYEPHVRNLAQVPAKSFHKTQEYDPVEAVETPEGYVVQMGAHRATAAVVRGDKTLRARVSHRLS